MSKSEKNTTTQNKQIINQTISQPAPQPEQAAQPQDPQAAPRTEIGKIGRAHV